MKILLPVNDFTHSYSRLLLEWMVHTLIRSEVGLYLLHIVPISFTEYSVSLMSEEEGQQSIGAVRYWLESQGFTVKKALSITSYDNIADEICKYANQWQVNQILMTTNGKSSFMNILMGNVSERVFKLAKQPVLVLNLGKKPALKISHIDKVTACSVK